jgi:dihydrofolate reductase
VPRRKIIVNIATSADGYVARPEPIAAFAERLRGEHGKNVWMMGGGEIIASFLEAGAIDEFILTVVPTFIGEGIPLIAPRHRHTKLGRPRFKKRSDQAEIARSSSGWCQAPTATSGDKP